MASISSEYMTNEKENETDKVNKSGSFAFYALIHSVGTDLLPLLMATKIGINRLPVIHFSEAHT